MKTFKINIRFPDGAMISRTEWGKSKRDALRTIESIYGEIGKDFFVMA